MDIEQSIIDELRCGALTAVDGLWFMAAERKLGFEGALELDIEVWRQYGVIMLKRACRLLGIALDPDRPPALETINHLLEVLCAIDGTECASEVEDPGTALFTVRRCTWWENLKKAGRENDVPCELIDNSTFVAWLEAVDPTLEMQITRSLPRGDDCCTWKIKRRA
jgi:hypothetical protein